MDTALKARMAPSLGLLTIARLFEGKHTVILENENIRPIDFDAPADVVGISVTVDVIGRAAEIARRFREKGVPVVAGGIHITASPKEVEGLFDALSVGIAEKTWPSILDDLENGRPLQKIYRCSGAVSPAEILPPAYRLVNKRDYLYCNIVSTSRGCPFGCDFCYNSCEAYRNFYVNREIEDVLDDIREIGLRHIMFIDDNLIGNPDWTRRLVRALRPLGLKWNAAVSANLVEMPDLMDEMAASGCQSLFIGFESLSAEALRGVHKGQNQTAKYERLIEEIHRRGMMVNASFVFGLDGDDETTFSATVDWIVKNRIETITSHILTPYPGTALYDRMLAEGRITDFDRSHYTTAEVVFRPKGMSAAALQAGYLRVYREVYSFRNIPRRLPKTGRQIVPYLLFNLFYRKFGPLTDALCGLVSYERIGRLAEWMSYRL